MDIIQVTEEGQIKKGDLLIIDWAEKVESATVAEIVKLEKTSEIIINKRRNLYFNVAMYLAGESWAKDVRIVRTNCHRG